MNAQQKTTRHQLRIKSNKTYEKHFYGDLLTNKSDFSVLKRLFIKIITKTYLYNFDPIKPHFYIVKLGFIGENIIFVGTR